jgi:N-ethylmaleimide reductase
MAPLTRSRADDAGVPGELQKTYYSQRASAGLIVTEATNISAQGKGYIRTPGIWTKEQVEGWKLTTKAVHDKGGHIFLQLWHVGRVSHPDLQPGGALPVAPSAVRAEGQRAYTYKGFKDLVTPRALETDEIPGIVADYAHAAHAPRTSASTAWRFTPRMATCCSSSSPTKPTSAPTAMAGRSKTGRASWSRSRTRSRRCGAAIASASAWRR